MVGEMLYLQVFKRCSILCSKPKCLLAFHVTYGLKNDLSVKYKDEKMTAIIIACLCKMHIELWRTSFYFHY